MTTRPTRLETYHDILRALAERSTCLRAKTATALIHNRNIISVGYNGPPANCPPCSPDSCTPSCTISLHAERNAIQRCPVSLCQPLFDVTLITLLSPCVRCAKLIISHPSIRRVIYFDAYRLTDGVDLLEQAGIPCLWTVQNPLLNI